ncbi:MAG: hypothetical protein ABIH24_07965 [Verrucomicrobiota bacterium]
MEFLGRGLAAREVIDGQHGVGLTAAEGSLELDDGITALAGQPLDHGIQEQAHAFRDEGALEKQDGVLIFVWCRLGHNLAQVSGEG